jgi:hypothetical protein
MIILEMPASGAAMQEFEPQRVDYAAPESGGRLGGVQAGFPLWLAVWTWGTIGARRSDLLRAWSARMRGQINRFYGRDLARPYPLAHICGFSRMTKVDETPFLGAASAWSQSIDSDGNALLTLEGLPAGLILSVGDYCDFRWTATSDDVAGMTWRDLVRVTADPDGISGDNGFVAMADADGTVTVMVDPPVSGVTPDEAVAHLDRPACIMAIVTDKTKLSGIDRRLALKSGSTIVGLQDLRP